MHVTMHTQKAAQQAPRAVDPSPEQKKPAADATTRSDDRETILDDDLYGNLAHTD